MPTSAMLSVRGIGVAVIVRTSTRRRRLLDPLFVRHPEALLLIHDQQPKVLEPHIFR